MATYAKAVAKWLLGCMIATGWTNKQALAKKSGVGRSTLYEILSGTGFPSPGNIADLATAMGTDGPDFALGTMQEPSDASGWIGEAQAALDKAVGLLPSQPTESERAGKDAKRGLKMLGGVGEPEGRPRRKAKRRKAG